MPRKRNSFNKTFSHVSIYGLQELSKFFVKLSRTSPITTDVCKTLFDKFNEQLLLQDSFLIVGELNRLSYPYVSPGCKEITGYDQKKWIKYGSSFLIRNFCPADRTMAKKFLDKMISHQKEVPLEEKSFYHYSMPFRYYHQDGYYIFLNSHLNFRAHDKQGNPTLILTILTAINDFKKNDMASLKISRYDPNLNKADVIHYEEALPDGLNLLNENDCLILGLLADGLTNADIAHKLNYSEHTVKDYRKRMLKKTWCSNTNELIYYALRNKLIN